MILIGFGCSSSSQWGAKTEKYAFQLCRTKLQPFQIKLEKTLNKKNMEESKNYFQKLEIYAFEMGVLRVPRYESDNLVSFQKHSKKLQIISFQGVQACQENKIDLAKKTYNLLKKTCVACHEEYKFDF